MDKSNNPIKPILASLSVVGIAFAIAITVFGCGNDNASESTDGDDSPVPSNINTNESNQQEPSSLPIGSSLEVKEQNMTTFLGDFAGDEKSATQRWLGADVVGVVAEYSTSKVFTTAGTADSAISDTWASVLKEARIDVSASTQKASVRRTTTLDALESHMDILSSSSASSQKEKIQIAGSKMLYREVKALLYIGAAIMPIRYLTNILKEAHPSEDYIIKGRIAGVSHLNGTLFFHLVSIAHSSDSHVRVLPKGTDLSINSSNIITFLEELDIDRMAALTKWYGAEVTGDVKLAFSRKMDAKLKANWKSSTILTPSFGTISTESQRSRYRRATYSFARIKVWMNNESKALSESTCAIAFKNRIG